jgi:hypothetical protein
MSTEMRPYETYEEYAARCRELRRKLREEESRERVSRFFDEYEKSERPEMIRRILERAERRGGQR